MKYFSAVITDASGDTSTFELTIDEVKQSGYIVWPVRDSKLIKMKITNEKDKIQCWMKWTYFSLRCSISAKIIGSTHNIIVSTAGSDHVYTLSETDFNNYLNLVKSLSLPVENLYEEPVKDDEVNDSELPNNLDEIEMTYKHVSLFIAWKFGQDHDVEFNKISVNNRIINISRPVKIPGDQGFYIPLGLYRKSKDIIIAWEFETGYIHEPATVILGILRNQDLKDRTEIKRMSIETFETYSGDSTITV